jgi:hypothetical protein
MATFYSWSHPNGGVSRYFVGGFFVVWLCAWLGGMVFATSILLGVNAGKGPPMVFLMAWLTSWTVGGLFAMFIAYKILRPGVPEAIVVSPDTLIYDSGTISPLAIMMPFHFGMRTNPLEAFNAMFKKRRILEFEKTGFSGFVFENSGAQHRLYFDDGADRLVVGVCLREPDREWLASELAEWTKTK